MKEKKLTEKQELIFGFIKQEIIQSGYPPTVREIGEKFNITVKGAYDHIKAIEKKGFIRTEQNKSRAIVINDNSISAGDTICVPLLGRIAAGMPILAQENIEEYLSFPKAMMGNGNFFALEVKGDSMIGAGIFDGDIAIIKQQTTANNGEIVAALIEDEATLKRFKLQNGKAYLIPENQLYKPIISEQVTILGKLSAVFRAY
jgi:repressor LexA